MSECPHCGQDLRLPPDAWKEIADLRAMLVKTEEARQFIVTTNAKTYEQLVECRAKLEQAEAHAQRLEETLIRFRTLAYGCAPLSRLKEIDDEYVALIHEKPPALAPTYCSGCGDTHTGERCYS